jgi:hypothetical protein
MPRVTFDHNPNEGVYDLPEEAITDIERMGFSVTRVDKPERPQPQSRTAGNNEQKEK